MCRATPAGVARTSGKIGVYGALLAGALVCFNAPAAVGCPSGHIDARARVVHVIDGDTVVLAEGHHVRLIGLDAPELGHDGRPSQPFARRALVGLLAGSHDRVELRYGQVSHDRYGRTLAYLCLPSGASVTADLLREGLAVAFTVPPNLWNLACYERAESSARRAHRGIWSLPRYQPIGTRDLPAGAKGFHIVRGRVVHIGRSRNARWIDLDGRVAVRIADKDLPYFEGIDFRALRGKEMTVRGWVHVRRGERVISVRYPSALKIQR